MADRKISDLTALTTPASGDYLPIVDISEAAAASKNKRITIEELMRGVPDGTAAAPGIAFETDPNTGIYRPGADQLAVSTGGTGRLFVDATGNVGIGGPPGQALQLTRSAASAFIQITDGTINSYFGVSNAASAVVIDVASNTPFRISTNNTERLRITSAGLVGIGTSAIQAGHTLQVNGIIASVTPFGAFTALQTAGGTGFRWTLANEGTCRLQKTTDGFAASTSTEAQKKRNISTVISMCGIDGSAPPTCLTVMPLVMLGPINKSADKN